MIYCLLEILCMHIIYVREKAGEKCDLDRKYWLSLPSLFTCCYRHRLGFPSGSAIIESACIAGDAVLIPRSEQSSARGHGNPLQYSAQTWTHSLAT